jgi:RNA polymerase sigma factor (sigma-70 family)
MPLDAAQLAQLIESQAGSLRLWVRARCASPEDVVQDAFCRLAVADPPPQQPVAWLYRVCRNLAEKQRLSDLRRRRRERAAAERETSLVDDGNPIELEETLAAVNELDANLREVLVARIWGQLSFEEISGLCHISAATAWRRYQAALEALRSRLEVCCENRK